MHRSPLHVRVALPLLVALGAALRLPWLASRPLWLDEALQYHVSSAPDVVGVLERSVAEDLAPPGYALVAHALLQLGDDDLLLRLPAYLAGVAAIAVAWPAVRAFAGDRAALIAAALVAVCPPCVAWSREARPYTVALLALFALLWAAGQARRGRTLPLVGAAVLSLPWHYGAWLVLAAVLLALALDPETRRAAVAAAGAALITAAPLLLVLLPQLSARGDIAHLTRFTGLGALPGAPWLLGWLATGSASPFSLVLGVLLLPLLWSRDLRLLRIGLAPVLVVLVAALAGWYPLGPVRHALVLVPGLVLLVAARLPASPAIVGCTALALLAVARAPGVPVHDVPALLAALEAARGEHEPVWIDPMLSWPVRRYGAPEGATFGRWGEDWPDHGWVLTVGQDGADLDATGVRAIRVGDTP